MMQLATWRVTSDDLAAIEPYIDAGDVSIVTQSDWLDLKPEPEEQI